MHVFGLTTGADTAGINVAIAGAFRRHAPDWDVRAMVASRNYIDYPVDVPWHQARLEELYDAADVIHLHNTLHGHRWYDNGQGKPIVLMHHGLKNGSERPFAQMVRDAAAIGATQVCSTLDLAIHEPTVQWLPPPVNLTALRAIRRRYPPRRPLRIGHAPTNREIKGSDAFDAALDAMQRDGIRVTKVLIEKRPWRECLELKATCDLFWDQPVLGYGSNAIEAWAMGIPVIAGVADPKVRAGMIDRWGVLPFYEASEATLEDALRQLVANPELRGEYTAIGTAHVERWHDERVTVETLLQLYPIVKATKPGGSERRSVRGSGRTRHWRRDQRLAQTA